MFGLWRKWVEWRDRRRMEREKSRTDEERARVLRAAEGVFAYDEQIRKQAHTEVLQSRLPEAVGPLLVLAGVRGCHDKPEPSSLFPDPEITARSALAEIVRRHASALSVDALVGIVSLQHIDRVTQAEHKVEEVLYDREALGAFGADPGIERETKLTLVKPGEVVRAFDASHARRLAREELEKRGTAVLPELRQLIRTQPRANRWGGREDCGRSERSQAARWLARMGPSGREAAPTLVAEFSSANTAFDSWFRSDLAEASIAIDPELASKTFRAQAGASCPEAAGNALDILAEYAWLWPDAIQQVAAALDRSEWGVQVSAAFALPYFGAAAGPELPRLLTLVRQMERHELWEHVQENVMKSVWLVQAGSDGRLTDKSVMTPGGKMRRCKSCGVIMREKYVQRHRDAHHTPRCQNASGD